MAARRGPQRLPLEHHLAWAANAVRRMSYSLVTAALVPDTECRCGSPKGPVSERCLRCDLLHRQAEKAARNTRVCAECQGSFLYRTSIRNVGRFCSRDCAFSYIRRVKRELSDNRRSVRVGLHGPWLQCPSCDSPCAQRARTCLSAECRKKYAASAAIQSAVSKRLPEPPRACQACRATFAPAYGDRRRRFCSTACGRNFARRGKPKNAEARARARGVKVDYSITNTEVFNRDGWRCQLCRRPTPRRLKGSYDGRAPELDHIVPFAAGGAHTWDNVQCACRDCNQRKGDKPLGQPRLVA